MALAWQEVRKTTGRRGSFYAAVGLTALASLAALLIRLSLWAGNDAETAGGVAALEDQAIIVQLAVILMVMVAAQVGSWDVANGTFRYLAMTGEPRASLYLARVPAIAVVALAILVPYWAISLLAAFALPLDQGEAASASDAATFLWYGFSSVVAWGLVAMGVGALLRSNGAAIAFSAVLYLGGFPLGGLLTLISEDLPIVLLNFATLRLGGQITDEFDLAPAIAVAAAWIAVAIALGGLRTARAEY